MAKAAEVAGQSADVLTWRKKAEDVKATFQRTFYEPVGNTILL
jgi:hypothetical protein